MAAPVLTLDRFHTWNEIFFYPSISFFFYLCVSSPLFFRHRGDDDHHVDDRATENATCNNTV